MCDCIQQSKCMCAYIRVWMRDWGAPIALIHMCMFACDCCGHTDLLHFVWNTTMTQCDLPTFRGITILKASPRTISEPLRRVMKCSAGVFGCGGMTRCTKISK